MPAKSKKQLRFMQAVAHSPSFAKKVGVPQSVGKEFTMKKAKGGVTEYGGMEKYASKAAMKKHEAKETPMEEKLEKKMGKNMARATMQKKSMAKGGGISSSLKAHAAAPASKAHAKMAKGGGIEIKGKTKGTMVKMAGGGCMKRAGRGR